MIGQDIHLDQSYLLDQVILIESLSKLFYLTGSWKSDQRVLRRQEGSDDRIHRLVRQSAHSQTPIHMSGNQPGDLRRQSKRQNDSEGSNPQHDATHGRNVAAVTYFCTNHGEQMVVLFNTLSPLYT